MVSEAKQQAGRS